MKQISKVLYFLLPEKCLITKSTNIINLIKISFFDILSWRVIWFLKVSNTVNLLEGAKLDVNEKVKTVITSEIGLLFQQHNISVDVKTIKFNKQSRQWCDRNNISNKIKVIHSQRLLKPISEQLFQTSLFPKNLYSFKHILKVLNV